MVDNRCDMIMIDLEITLYVHHIMYMYGTSICIPKTIIMLIGKYNRFLTNHISYTTSTYPYSKKYDS